MPEMVGMHGHEHNSGGEGGANAAATTIDPVCGMRVDPATTAHHAEHAGHAYHFCSAGCRAKFVAHPDRYLNPREPEPARVGAIYTCPMHPQIRQVAPRGCP